MKGYGTFCPVAKTAEVFAERWTPLVLREMCMGARRFSELQQALPKMSRTLLVRRLRELETQGVVCRVPKASGVGHDYVLTAAGEEFRPLIDLMGRWSQRWGQGRLQPTDIDPAQLLWGLRRHLDAAHLPSRRIVVQFEFRGLPKGMRASRYWWLVLMPTEVDICEKNLGYDVDVVINADIMSFTRVWLGYDGLSDALRRGLVSLAGSRAAIAAVRLVLGLQDAPTMKDFNLAPRYPTFSPLAVGQPRELSRPSLAAPFAAAGAASP